MTLKKRLWDTICLTLFGFILLVLSSFGENQVNILLGKELISFKKIILIGFSPVIFFLFQAILEYLKFPVFIPNKKSRKKTAILFWILLLLPFTYFPYLFISKIILNLSPKEALVYVFAPLLWIYYLNEVRRTFGRRYELFFVIVLLFCLFAFPPDKCPQDKPFKDWEGNCYACNTSETLHTEYSQLCSNVCPSRIEVQPSPFLRRYDCYLKPEVTREKPLMGIGQDKGQIFSCDEPRAIEVFNCEICPGRVSYRNTNLSSLCYLKECPKTHPLKGDDHTCYACNELKTIYADNCEVCSERIGKNVNFKRKRCELIDCPSSYPLKSQDDYWGAGCFACDDSAYSILDVTQEDCEKCPNRHFEKFHETGKCIKNSF